MNERQKVVYTLRNVPDEADARVREVATAEGVSLNTALLRVIERGLGGERAPARRRDLRPIVQRMPASEERAWRSFLESADVVDPEKWKE